MLAFVLSLLMIWVIMWAFFKFMYPKPPKAFMPKQGDVITPRECDFCGYPLAEYRGVTEAKPSENISDQIQERLDSLEKKLAGLDLDIKAFDEATLKGKSWKEKKQIRLTNEQKRNQRYQIGQEIKEIKSWFFCNYDHQADFHKQHGHNTKNHREKYTLNIDGNQ